MSPDIIAVVALIIAYLMGSFSSAIVVCHLMGLPDPRNDGSKNPGTTNVLRIGGKVPALLTQIGDVIKGVIPILIGRELNLDNTLLSAIGFAAFIGHLYPLFFKFEGGKGVATALGVLLALHWQLGLAVLAIWLLAFVITRISSVGAITAFVAAPFLAYYLWMPDGMLGIAGMSILLLARHKENMKALIEGRERRFKQ